MGFRLGLGYDSKLWICTKQSLGQMAQIAKKTKRYPSDLTYEEWDQVALLMPKPGRRGRPHEVDSGR